MSNYKFKKCEGPDYLTRDKSFKYSGNADAVIVPDETISITSKSFKILKAIRLGRNVSKVNNNCVECFEVDPSNPFFSSVNGVLYSKNGKTLVAYPSLLNETEYIIPDSVTAINSGAFFHSNLEKVIFNKNIRKIGKEAFSGMLNLISVDWPENTHVIQDGTFFSCRSLSEINIPKGVIKIGEKAFASCKSLTKLSLPDTILKIGEFAFHSCEKLKSVKLPSGLEVITKYDFDKCCSLESVTLPKNLKKIHYDAFANCKNLKRLDLPDGLFFIGIHALLSTGIESIVLPDSVQHIGTLLEDVKNVSQKNPSKEMLDRIKASKITERMNQATASYYSNFSQNRVVESLLEKRIEKYKQFQSNGLMTLIDQKDYLFSKCEQLRIKTKDLLTSIKEPIRIKEEELAAIDQSILKLYAEKSKIGFFEFSKKTQIKKEIQELTRKKELAKLQLKRLEDTASYRMDTEKKELDRQFNQTKAEVDSIYNEANSLGLKLDKYDKVIAALVDGMFFRDFYEFNQVFSKDYSIDQYRTLKRLSGPGMDNYQKLRYIKSFANKMSEKDYEDYVELENFGLSEEECNYYLSNLKNKMSIYDYFDSLQKDELEELEVLAIEEETKNEESAGLEIENVEAEAKESIELADEEIEDVNNKTEFETSDKLLFSDEKESNEFLLDSEEEQINSTISEPPSSLNNLKICLTGEFSYGTKAEVENFIVARGGICVPNVTNSTNMLIIGEKGSKAYSFGSYGKKYEKALTMSEIQILKEKEFFESYKSESSLVVTEENTNEIFADAVPNEDELTLSPTETTSSDKSPDMVSEQNELIEEEVAEPSDINAIAETVEVVEKDVIPETESAINESELDTDSTDLKTVSESLPEVDKNTEAGEKTETAYSLDAIEPFFKPGEEPSRLRSRLDSIFEKLDSAYPDKVIVKLQKEHGHWSETVKLLSRALGYPDTHSFLKAYGYQPNVSGSRLGNGEITMPKNNDSGTEIVPKSSQAIFDLSNDKPIWEPGNEPARLHTMLYEFLRQIDEAYPDKKVPKLEKDDPKLAECALIWALTLNYSNYGSFLSAYGYQSNTKGGRPAGDHMALIDELKRRYPEGPTCSSVSELSQQNPDIAPKFKNIQNKSVELFGMSFTQYLAQEGLLKGTGLSVRKGDDYYHEQYELLKSRYSETPFTGSLLELKEQNSDIEWLAVEKEQKSKAPDSTIKKFLAEEGIIQAITLSGKPLLDYVTEELKKRYPETARFDGSIEKLRFDNPDLPISSLQFLTKEHHNISAKDYLIREGVIAHDQTPEEKLLAIEKALIEKYKGKPDFPTTVKQIQEENKDLKLSSISTLINSVKGMTSKEYFISIGVIPEQELNDTITLLKKRYEGIEHKPRTLSELAEQNPDVDIQRLDTLIKRLYEYISSEDYLINRDILTDDEKEKLNAAIKAQAESFKNDLPFNELYDYYLNSYTEQTKNNPFFKIPIPSIPEKDHFNNKYSEKYSDFSEVTPDGFVIKRSMSDEEPNVELIKYQGTAEIVTVPDYVTEIDDIHTVFENDNIKQIVLPDGIKGLNKRSFSEKVIHNLTNSDGFFIVGSSLLAYYGSSSDIIIPDGVETILYGVFDNNQSIKTVIMPKSIKNINNSAFSRCKNLSQIVFSKETKELDFIGYYAFNDCTALERFDIPKVKEIDKSAFKGCNQLIDNNNGFIIIGTNLLSYSGKDERVSVPQGVTSITVGAFFDNNFLQEVILPSTLTTIGKSAFCLCSNLRQINLENVTIIRSNAFSCCECLEEIVLSNKLVLMESEAFESCSKLRRIIVRTADGDLVNSIPESLSSIPSKAFENCSSLSSISVPGSVKNIGDEAFADCSSLSSISVPGSVKTIGDKAFMNCSMLKKVCLQDGVETIGKECFWRAESLEEIIIPSTVNSIGKDAFKYSNIIELPERFNLNKDYYGIPDENNCFIENGVLVGMRTTDESVVQITDGVVVIEQGSLNITSIFSDIKITKVILPDSVRAIRHEDFGYSPKFDMNIPKGYLLQKKLPVVPLKTLLRTVWKLKASMLDWVSIFINQNNKELNDYCIDAFSKAPNAFVAAAIVIINNSRSKEVDRVGEVVYDLRQNMSQEFIDRYYKFAKENKAKSTISVLKPFASSAVGGELNKEKVYADELEEYCDEQFEKHEFERILQKAKLKDKVCDNSGVKYAEKDELVPTFVLECAVVPYIGQMKEKEENSIYNSFHILEDSDRIAEKFEKTSFENFLDTLSYFSKDYHTPQIWIPICRFGSGKQISSLISRMKDWNSWYQYGKSGRIASSICEKAILLSDTREAMLYAEKNNNLEKYAQLRGVSADVIRDTKMIDFGFNNEGKINYDIGSTIIEASIGSDLSIVLYDTSAKTAVKSIPKKNADPKKYDACAAAYYELRKNIKKVYKSRRDLLFDYFISGKRLDLNSWTEGYTQNPILYKLASLLVWSQGKASFTLSKGGLIDSYGNNYELQQSRLITVAHPVNMNDEEIKRWQDYFVANNLKQPFEQIWEPKIDKNTIKSDRYKDCMIPYYRFIHQEKIGIYVDDYNFHDDIEIRISGCTTRIDRIDWDIHSIDPQTRFEIVSFDVNGMSRMTNHIVYYLDKCAIYGIIEKDNASVLDYLHGSTIAQIDAYIKYATEKGSTNCTAILLNYKNEHFPEYNFMDTFTLD